MAEPNSPASGASDDPFSPRINIDDTSRPAYPLEKMRGRQSQRRRQQSEAMHRKAGRVPPQATDVEQSVLGAMLIEGEAIPKAIEVLPPEAFYSAKHQHIYRSILNLFERGNPVDLVTLTEELKRHDQLDDVGGPYYLTELTTKVASAANVEYHARIIAEKSLLRKMIETMTGLVGEAYDPGADAFELLDSAESKIFQISDTQLRRAASPLNEVVKGTLEQLEAIHGRKGGITGVPSGFQKLDEMTSGWQNSDLIIIAARPSMGKAQPLDAPVLTPTGWRPMGDLRPGDCVIGSDGQPTRVVGVFPQGVKQTYRVRFADGTSAECCGEHLWHTTTRADRRRGRPGTARSTDAIRRTLTVTEGGRKRRNHQVTYVRPVAFPARELPLDPYVLGTWLASERGDGAARGAQSGHRRVARGVGTFGRTSLRRPPNAQPVVGCANASVAEAPGDAREAIRDLGLDGCTSEKKFVPSGYLLGSVTQRLALLHGLMDTDGALANDGRAARFTTVSPRLRDDVVRLVRSLGGRATWAARQTRYSHDGERRLGRVSYRVTMTFPHGDVCPFRLARKAARWTGLRRATGKAIVAVEPCREVACRCILVEAPDHLYVTEGYTLTHNTAFSLACALNASTHARLPTGVAIFSLEMGAQQLAQRLLTSEAKVDAQRARTGRMRDDDWQRLARAAGKLSEASVFIDDTPGLTVLELRAKCRRLKAEHDIGLVVVDYLQLMQGSTSNRNANREQEIAHISRSLKGLAKELNIPVIALSQLNRGVETRGGDKRPQLADLRESGSIEQDADVVAFIYRAERYGITVDEHGNSTQGIAEIIIGKQRNGPIGTVELAFVDRYALFENLDYQHNEYGGSPDGDGYGGYDDGAGGGYDDGGGGGYGDGGGGYDDGGGGYDDGFSAPTPPPVEDAPF